MSSQTIKVCTTITINGVKMAHGIVSIGHCVMKFVIKKGVALIQVQQLLIVKVSKQPKWVAGVAMMLAKRSKGANCHILVDTQGNLLKVLVHPANITDREGARVLLQILPKMLRKRLKLIWADQGYRGKLVEWCREYLQTVFEIVSRPEGVKGFILLPRRWVVERTFAWLGNYRRLSKDYEELAPLSEGMIYLASIHRMLRRITP